MLILFITYTVFSQVETFYDESNEIIPFTLGKLNFTLTGDLMAEVITILTTLDNTCSIPNCLAVNKLSVFEQN